MGAFAMARVGQQAPDFETLALVGEDFKTLKLSDYKGKYLVLFFYPLDFTFVCPTEILSFSDRAKEFHDIGCELVGASVDSHFTHLAWVNTPRVEGGLGGALNIPLLSDLGGNISRNYGVMLEEAGHTLRGLFIISDKGIVRHITMNDPPVGRNVGEVRPANWKPGNDTMKPDPKGSKSYFEKTNA